MWEWWRKYRPFVLGCVLLLSALLWYSVSLRQQEQTGFLESVVLRATGPVQGGFERFIAGSADLWERYLYLIDTAQDNRHLLEENRTLKAELAHNDEIRLENRRLRLLLDFKEAQTFESLPARVIAEDASSWFRTVTIDKGMAQGVAEGMSVVVAEGVVGRVIRSSERYSRVLLITDASSAVASLLQKNRARGVCRGQGEQLVLDFVLRLEQVAVGDRVVTSGMGGVFPKGLVVGTVDSVERRGFGLFQEVTVTAAVDFSHLEEVLVLLRSPQ
ncbi:MAG: rod shape-determining protein MreC [Desulfuromonadales bacterium]|nr:rod shape-determining protein MreC [Desulfuromonadales bacterium]